MRNWITSGWSEEEHTALQTMYEVSYAFSLQGIVQMVMRKLLEILFQSASLVIDTIRTFFLIVLSILGPIAFALSVFDGLQNTLVQWLERYISVYVWLPVADLFGAMLAKIQTLILQEEMNLMADPMSVIDVDGYLGHLSDIHGHRHYRIFLCAHCFELDCPSGRYECL